MAFDFSTLITDRTLEDVAARNEKGSYNATDLNRVDACLDDLVARLSRVGCNVPGYKRVKIERAVTPSSRLPEGYTELEYIQSSGTQYVNTEFNVTSANYQNLKMSIVCEKIGKGSGISDWLLDGSNASNAYFYTGVFNGKYYYGCGTLDHDTEIAAHSGKKTYILDIPLKKFSVSNEVDVSITIEAVASSAPIILFGFFYSPIRSYAEKIYSCQIYDNDVLARNFIPCKAPSGDLGLYDLSTAKFYGNAGTGSFTAGPVIERPKDPNEGLDPYTWYERDVPTVSLLSRYRDNVAAVRAVLRLPEGTPEVPETMRRLTTAEANSIEAILLALNFILNNIPAAVRHCGVTVCGSKGVIA